MYNNIISIENLLEAWKEFLLGKKNRKDIQEFQYKLTDNILDLHTDLKNKTYTHGGYLAFNISDPKPRNIHKASVRDRLVHHAIYKILYLYFDPLFIYDSYSCRKNKGTHKAIERYKEFGYKVSKNYTKQAYVLKCDVKKFFASIDQEILINILNKKLLDKSTVGLLSKIIKSFYSTQIGKGLPLGNLTSQLLVNIYMNSFDHFIKETLKVRYYIRYADDFIVMDTDKEYLLNILDRVNYFLEKELKLKLHPDKVYIKTLTSGVDFLGWVHFRDHRVLRTTTKKRMLKNIRLDKENKSRLESYRGLLKWGNGWKLEQEIEKVIETNMILVETL